MQEMSIASKTSMVELLQALSHEVIMPRIVYFLHKIKE